MAAVIAWYVDRPAASQRIPDKVSYNFHIRPILSDRCFKCHGPDAKQRKANLRLDTEEGLYKSLREDTTRHVIVPGKPNESELYNRVHASDTSFLMPPPSSNLSLTSVEVDLIRKWIRQGAEYQEHWAFVAPRKESVPETDEEWARNEIDNFVYARMDEQGLEPNDEADQERLLKRL